MFPKFSAFHQDNDFGSDLTPLAELQENRAQQREASLRKEARIPTGDLEDIVASIRQLPWRLDIVDPMLNEEVDELVERLSSYFPG